MSVVNQMLKDLEDRKADDAGLSAVYQPTESSKSGTWVIVFVVLLLILVAILGWMVYSNYVVTNNNQVTTTEVRATPQIANTPDQASKTIDDVLGAEEKVTSASTSDSVVDTSPLKDEAVSDVELIAENLTQSTQAVDQAIEQPAVQAPVEEVQSISVMTVQKSSNDSPPIESTDFRKQASGSLSTGVSLREQALAALRSGQDELGIQLLTQLTQLEPMNVAAYKKLAAVLYSQNKTTQAISVLEQGIGISPKEADLRLMLGRLLSQQNESERALIVITPELPLAGKSQEFLGFRAALAEKLGNHEVAYKDYLQLSAEQPSESRWWLGLAVSSERMSSNQMAIEAYQRVIVLNQLGNEVTNFAQQRINQLARIQ